MCTPNLAVKPEGENHSRELAAAGRIILKLILEKHCMRVPTGFIWLRIGTSGGLL
jgi:hypothetical protein